MSKTETLNRLAESRQAFLLAIEGLSEDQITQIPVEGIWTIKDLLGHLATWEMTCVVPLRSYVAGGEFIPGTIPDHQVWNEAQARGWQVKSLAEILAEYQSIREEMVALVTALPEAQWEAKLPAPWGGKANVGELCNGLIWHESTEHLKSIQYWKETGKPR
jgi:hypothetical protein